MLQLLFNKKMFNKIYDLTLNAKKGPFHVVFFSTSCNLLNNNSSNNVKLFHTSLNFTEYSGTP